MYGFVLAINRCTREAFPSPSRPNVRSGQLLSDQKVTHRQQSSRPAFALRFVASACIPPFPPCVVHFSSLLLPPLITHPSLSFLSFFLALPASLFPFHVLSFRSPCIIRLFILDILHPLFISSLSFLSRSTHLNL